MRAGPDIARLALIGGGLGLLVLAVAAAILPGLRRIGWAAAATALRAIALPLVRAARHCEVNAKPPARMPAARRQEVRS